jgi:hypothetical protein
MRILHVGNIANNGYLAAKKERENGFESYLVNVNAHHVMMMPEWEELNLEFEYSQYSTDMLKLKSKDIPSWVLSGSWSAICDVLFPSTQFAKKLNLNSKENRKLDNFLRIMIKLFRNWIPKKLRPFIAYNVLYRLRNINDDKHIKRVFASFDKIIFYGPFCNLSKYVENGRYIAFEHGTLRNFIDTNYKLAKNTKIGFENASVILISNQDCLSKAKNIFSQVIIKSPHPINDSDFPQLRELREKYLPNRKDTTLEVLVPARHTFSISTDIGKGNEIIYMAIKELFLSNENIIFHLIKWGENFPSAEKYLKEFENAGFVKWHNLMTRPKLKGLMINSDAVIDQLLIPAYGGISIDAIGLGVPLLTNQVGTIDTEYFGSVAPIFPINNTETIVDSLRRLSLESIDAKRQYFIKSCEWFDQNLSSELSLAARIAAYKELEKI